MSVSAPQRPARSGTSRSRALAATPDATLVALAAQGDERAFELLFQRHHDSVQAYAVRMLQDHGRAEDVVQDVFVSAVRAITGAPVQQQPTHVRAWLREIARRACIDQWRGSTRRGEVSLDAPEALLAGDAQRLSDHDSLTRATDDRASMDTLRRAFADLPALQHAVLVQRELEGRSPDEIASRLGITRTVVEGQLARGRRALSRAYRELESGERCVAARGLCDSSLERHLGVRDRHRLGGHLRDCDPCRRHARALGVDARLLDRDVLARASLLLPLPLLRRLPFESALAGETAGGVLGSKVLAGAAVLVAGSSGVYVTSTKPTPPGVAPRVSHVVDARESAPALGTSGAPVLRLGTDGRLGLAPVGLPVRAPDGELRAARPFLPPWGASVDDQAQDGAPSAGVPSTPSVPSTAPSAVGPSVPSSTPSPDASVAPGPLAPPAAAPAPRPDPSLAQTTPVRDQSSAHPVDPTASTPIVPTAPTSGVAPATSPPANPPVPLGGASAPLGDEAVVTDPAPSDPTPADDPATDAASTDPTPVLTEPAPSTDDAAVAEVPASAAEGPAAQTLSWTADDAIPSGEAAPSDAVAPSDDAAPSEDAAAPSDAAGAVSGPVADGAPAEGATSGS